MQALRHLDRATEKDQRWQAELNFKVSLPLQIMDRVPEATDHIVSALAQMKSHLKQVRYRGLSLRVCGRTLQLCTWRGCFLCAHMQVALARMQSQHVCAHRIPVSQSPCNTLPQLLTRIH